MTRAQANTLLIAQALAEPGRPIPALTRDTGRWHPDMIVSDESHRLRAMRRVALEKYGFFLDYSALERRTGVVVGRWVRDPRGGLKLELFDAGFVP